jgi:hypothetical protein
MGFIPLLYGAAINYPTLVASTMRHLQHYNSELLLVDLRELAINTLIIILYGGGIGRICIPLLWKIFANVTPQRIIGASSK